MKSLLVPFPVTLQSLEMRTDGKITGETLGIGGEGDVKFEDFQDLTIAVVLGSTAAGIASLALLPENVGATFTYLFALIPIGFIGVGSVAVLISKSPENIPDFENANNYKSPKCS